MQRFLKQSLSFLLGGLIVAAIFWANGDGNAPGAVQIAYAQEPMLIPEAPNANPQLLFQGQLTNPASGQPVADGAYPMTFSLYGVTTGGSPLWTESKSVNVTSGSFATLLGGVNALNPDIFNGQNLFLGIQIGSDPEATPRQPIGYSAYAVRADRAGTADSAGNADKLDNLDSADFVRQGNGGIVAYGVVDADGSRVDGKRFSSRRASDGVFEITIDGEDYNLNRFSTVVTVIDNNECLGANIAKTGSSNGKLLVFIFNLSNQIVHCKFHFVTLEP